MSTPELPPENSSPAARTLVDAVDATILVVDDDPIARQLLRHVLEAQGYQVRDVASADEVFRQIDGVDLVLLDAVMRGRDGWQVCREIKAKHDPLLPVIMVTGRTLPADVLQTFAAGADDYVAKPFQVPELLARIASRLRTRFAEEGLRRALERNRVVGLATSEAIWEYDPFEGKIIWNDGLTRVFGHAPALAADDIAWWEQQVHPADRARVVASLDAAVRENRDFWSEEYRFRKGDGNYATVIDRGYAVRHGGNRFRFVGSLTDITTRRVSEQTLRFLSEASSLLSETLEFDQTIDRVARLAVGSLADFCLVHLCDDDGRVATVVGAAADPDFEGAIQLLAGRQLATAGDEHSAIGLVITSGNAADVPFALPAGLDGIDAPRPRRDAIPPTGYAIPLRARGRVLGAIVLGRSFGDRPFDDHARRLANDLARRAAVALDNARLYRDAQHAEARYRLLFDRHPTPLLVADAETDRLIAVNEAATRLYERSAAELLACRFDELVAPATQPARDRHELTAAAGIDNLQTHRTPSGELLEVEVRRFPLAYEQRDAHIVLVTDVRERLRAHEALRESEEQLRHAQKMEAVGRLAGGVAHDFNNLLTAIQGHAELLLAELEPGQPFIEDLEEIRRAAERATSLTRQLLAFSRRQVLQPEVLSINESVADMQRMLGRLIGEHIRLRTDFADDLPPVRADPGQIQQVVLNLVLNARDAMPDGGTLEIATARGNVDDPDAPTEVAGRPYIVLRISDDGEGIQPDLLEKIFEPFFTTKELGRGTGLGLSTVYGIVRQTGGAITVSSVPGAGTTFRVWLPAEDAALPGRGERDARPNAPGSGSILVVEDERAVRQLARRILERNGYRVLEAASADDAIKLADRAGEAIDLLLTDIVMPGLSGRELAEQLATRRPGLRLLFMSGYTEDAAVHHGVHREGVAFLEKPFSPAALCEKVRSVLDSPPPASLPAHSAD